MSEVSDGLVRSEIGGTRRIDPARGAGVSGESVIAGKVASVCTLAQKAELVGSGPRLQAAEVDRVGRKRMNVRLDAIVRDTSIQCRATIDIAVVNEYAEQMAAGAKFPPVVLFATNGKHWIGDGWHRIHASEQIGALDVDAEVRAGGRMEALKHALGANDAHGNRRSNADKRRCVEIALREFGKMSSRAIAEMCGVSHTFVDATRPALATVANAPTVTTTDGRQYPATREKKKRTQAEDRRVGWIAGDDDGQQQTPKPAAYQAPSNGIHFANIALINLKQITRDDTEREVAFSMIRRFLNDSQTAAH
jgi:hypothetical protein